jgi:hypothetical protein
MAGARSVRCVPAGVELNPSIVEQDANARQQSLWAGISQDWLSCGAGWPSCTPVCIECPLGMACCVASDALPSCFTHAMSLDAKLSCSSSVERANPVRRRSITTEV